MRPVVEQGMNLSTKQEGHSTIIVVMSKYIHVHVLNNTVSVHVHCTISFVLQTPDTGYEASVQWSCTHLEVGVVHYQE